MRIAAAHIITESRWEALQERTNITDRLKLLKTILSELRKLSPSPQLLILPAGFLVAKNKKSKKKACTELAVQLVNDLPKRHPTIAFGVDFFDYDKNKAGKKANSGSSFAYVVSPKKEKLIWGLQQQGVSCYSWVHEKDINLNRFFTVGDKKVALVICGEMTTRVKDVKGQPRLSSYIVQTRDKKKDVALVIDLTHADRRILRGNRSWFPAMEATGKPCVLAEHLWKSYFDCGSRAMCNGSKNGPDYSMRLKKPTTVLGSGYCLKIYDL